MSIKDKIEQQWLKRAEINGLKPKSVAYRKAELEFFCGAMAAIEAADERPRKGNTMSSNIPAIWVISLTTGRPVVEKKT